MSRNLGVNLDFTAIPYWGDSDTLENNWSGKRSKALASLQAVLAQDPDTGIICYGDTTITHNNQNEVVFEFLDFYASDPKIEKNLKFIVFDSKFTTYENLGKLDQRGIKFITIQRKGKRLVEKIAEIPSTDWKAVVIERANHKSRHIKACECIAKLNCYVGNNGNKTIRQIFIKNYNKVEAAIIITNDFDMPLKNIVRKYAKRWLVEKEISEQIHFFHLNKNSSGIVVKVDFDLTMSILAHNLYRLLVSEFSGYHHFEAKRLFTTFIHNSGTINITDDTIELYLDKKRSLPFILDSSLCSYVFKYSIFKNRHLVIKSSTST
jgi:hypothetical protein